MQALRQQQAQQQQHVIHEQRVQGKLYWSNFQFFLPYSLAIARVQRQISTDPAPQFLSPADQRSPLQIATNQELSPAASPSPSSRQFMSMKSPTYPHTPGLRPTTPTQAAPDFPQVPTPDNGDIYQAPPTPKANFQPVLPVDPYAQQPATPRPQFAHAKPGIQVELLLKSVVFLT